MNNFHNYQEQYQSLLDKARLWSRNQKNPTYLLVGEERKKAEFWLKQGFEVQEGLPEPKPLHYKFIEASYQQDFYDVLIVYESINLRLAVEVETELINSGFRVWCKHNANDKSINKQELIQRADNVLVLVDDKLVDSTVCQQDLQIAKNYNKPIISIILDKNFKEFAQNISSSSIVYTEKIIENLKQQINDNKTYLRNHSYFLVKALEWEWYGKPINSLLINDELTQQYGQTVD